MRISDWSSDVCSSDLISNKVMPSLAYGGKSCSLKFKAEVQESYLQGKQRGPNQSPGYAPAVSSWSAGLKVVRCIGYDDGAKDARRIGKSEDQRYIYVYPLREYHMDRLARSEEHTSELQSLMRSSYAVFCLKKKKTTKTTTTNNHS